MRRVLLSLSFLLILAGTAFAALHFPALTGRVVDDAGILSSGTQQALDQLLAAYEQRTTNQLVVVTLKSLEETSIEDYGVQLGRAWGIGQKDKNNGALLIVAPKEHKVRIEVGYGLEGTLTDAKCSEIVQQIILPAFRAGKMEGGVVSGTHAILAALDGASTSQTLGQAAPDSQTDEDQPPTQHGRSETGKQNSIGNLISFVFILICFLINFLRCLFPAFSRRHHLIGFYGGAVSGGFSGGGGGFSGGGGSFGGGGASGGW